MFSFSFYFTWSALQNSSYENVAAAADSTSANTATKVPIKSSVAIASDKEFIEALSDTLRLNKVATRKSWDSMLLSGSAVLSDAKAFDADPEELQKLRTVHFNNRHNSWFLLHEIFRLDNDRDHIYHEQAAAQIEILLTR